MPSESSETGLTSVARRVGDAQRAGCADTLADAYVLGQLSQEELDARTELCLRAVTDGDLERLTRDLAAPTTVEPAGSAAEQEDKHAGAALSRVVGFELVLVALAYVLGVDLESELRAWYVIAFEIWAVGSLAGLAGAHVLPASAAARSRPTGSGRRTQAPPGRREQLDAVHQAGQNGRP